MHIGKYKILGLLGKGGMGRVYKARMPVIEKIVALKRLTPAEHMIHLLGRQTVEELFINEARTLARIRHPHIASILDFDRDQQKRPFFVMEYHCKNLGLLIGEHYVMEAPTRILPPVRAARIADQILAGLDRLHHAGIFHRDIKPYNVLITDEDQVSLIDFGLSLLRGEIREMPESFKVGTPFYAPPEQEADPNAVDERADLFSTGVLIWRMLTGFLPPEHGSPPRPGSLNTILGDCFDDFLRTATARDPKSRFADASAMRRSLATAIDTWRNQLEKTCRIFSAQPADLKTGHRQSPAGRRKQPVKIRPDRACRFFGLNPLWRPEPMVSADFENVDGQRIIDRTHGLIWQQSGERYPVDWHQAKAYVGQLNDTAHGGITTWRLPTVDELICLIRPLSETGDFCTPPLFDTKKQQLWSADRKSYTAAWFVDTALGYVADMDLTCRCHVRAVSDQALPNSEIHQKGP